MPECGIGLMAKFPLKGHVKTRLASEAGEEKALAIYRQLLGNAVDITLNQGNKTFHRVVFIDPPDKTASFEKLYPGFDDYFAQTGDDLGARMMSALQALLANHGNTRAMLIGVDIPDINTEIINNANSFLLKNDLVLGPTLDGGYYLIGLSRPIPELFDNIRWGGDTVYKDTMKIARDLGLKVGILEELRDLDQFSDLKYFSQFDKNNKRI